MSTEHADFSGVEHLAAVLACEVVSTFDHPELVIVGSCKIIEEVCIYIGFFFFFLYYFLGTIFISNTQFANFSFYSLSL
jgi:hypothetical protein